MNATQIAETSPRRAALIAGVGYLFLFFLAIYANFFVREGLVDPDNAAATFTNITDSEMLFRSGLIAFLIIFVLDIAIAWALYVLFKTVSQQLSLVTAWFRIVYTVFLGVGLIFGVKIYTLSQGLLFSRVNPGAARGLQLCMADRTRLVRRSPRVDRLLDPLIEDRRPGPRNRSDGGRGRIHGRYHLLHNPSELLRV